MSDEAKGLLNSFKEYFTYLTGIKAEAKIATCAAAPTPAACKVVCKTDCKERTSDNEIKLTLSMKAGKLELEGLGPLSLPANYACPKGKAMYKMGLAWWAILLIVLAVVIVVAAIVVVCVCCFCKKGKNGSVSTQKGKVMSPVK